MYVEELLANITSKL